MSTSKRTNIIDRTVVTPSSRPHYADNPSLFPMEGGCACGQIRYRLKKAPLVINCCHCTCCQRETGGGFSINASIEAGEVEQVPPTPATAPASAGRPDELPPLGPASQPPGDGKKRRVAGGVAPPVEPRIVVLPTESGRGQAVARCPACGVMLWSYYPGAGPFLKVLRVATLDRAFELAPDNHVHVRSARDFVRLADGKPAFETCYVDPDSVLRPESRDRYAKIRPEEERWRREVGRFEVGNDGILISGLSV